MIVFRKHIRREKTEDCLNAIRKLAADVLNGQERHEGIVDLMIRSGEFEVAIVDGLFKESDGSHPVERLVRGLTLLCGELFYASWRNCTGMLSTVAEQIARRIQEVESLKLPETVNIRTSEGFVYYGILPETYIKAAEKFCSENDPFRAVCIGIRSIGACLSAVVSAVLKHYGWDVYSGTVRPRGHPFERRADLTPEYEKLLKSYSGAYYLIVDEGPGLSGSSFCAVAKVLSDMGIENKKIVLFPCWEPDAEGFRSAEAKRRWQLHEKFSARFEEVWGQNGNLTAQVSPGALDVSAGKWRSFIWQDSAGYPAAHPHHEQRKYLFPDNGGPRFMMKFAGLGYYGKKKYIRQEKLSQCGVVQRPEALIHGFLVTKFREGNPFSYRHFIRKDQIHAMADYLSFIKKNFPSDESGTTDEIIHMIQFNIEQALGGDWLTRVEAMENLRSALNAAIPVEIDGRMFPYEWISTDNGNLKTDCVDHHMDQFFPQCQDVAWDVAGTCIEFAFDRNQQDCLIDRYQSLAGDQYIRWKLPFYSLAYLSYRMGYAIMAAESLGETEDGVKFRRMADRYGANLKRLLLLHAG